MLSGKHLLLRLKFRALSQRAQRGFNLVELMIGLAILAIVLFIGIPSMGAWLQSSQIRNAAESIQGGLQLARAEAVSRNTSVQFVLTSVAGGGVASDWVVSCVNAVPDPNCPGAGNAVTQIQQRFSNEGSPNAQVAVDPTSSAFPVAGNITFSNLGRPLPAPAAPPAEYRLIVTNPTGGQCAAAGGNMRCLGIAVSSGGQVRMCDPALPVGNPRAC